MPLVFALLLAVEMITGCRSSDILPVDHSDATPIETPSPIQETQSFETITPGSEQIADYIIIHGDKYSISLTSLEIGDYASRPLSDADIEPLRHMVNLTSLSLVGNRITDISPLSELTNLVSLELGYNELCDISPLSELLNLTDVDLSNNPVIDWIPVEYIENVWGRP